MLSLCSKLQYVMVFFCRLLWSRAVKEQIAASMSLGACETKLRAIRRERKTLREAGTNNNTKAEKAFENFATTTCRAFCESIYTEIPREVRDMIYGHLYRKTVIEVTSAYFEIDAPPACCDVSPHLLNAQTLGEAVHRELWEHFFRANSFEFHADFALLPEFRVTDPWNIGYVPGDLATHVKIDVPCSEYDANTIKSLKKQHEPRENRRDCRPNYHGGWAYTGSDAGSGKSQQGSKSLESHSELMLALEDFSGFTPGTKLSINVKPCWCVLFESPRDQEWACENIITLLSPSLERLRALGYHTRVVLQDHPFFSCKVDFVVEGEFTLESYKADFAKVSFFTSSDDPEIELTSSVQYRVTPDAEGCGLCCCRN